MSTEDADEGFCRSCEWCDESGQRYGFCHAHPYTKKPRRADIEDDVHKRERILCFPVVNPAMDWCKDWERAKGEQVAVHASTMHKTSGVWICDECGREHGRPTTGISTWNYATCDWCGHIRPCTEARDYGI